MIKNYQLLRKMELEIESAQKLTPQAALSIVGDMYEFAMKYQKTIVDPTSSNHMKMLLHLTRSFKIIAEQSR